MTNERDKTVLHQAGRTDVGIASMTIAEYASFCHAALTSEMKLLLGRHFKWDKQISTDDRADQCSEREVTSITFRTPVSETASHRISRVGLHLLAWETSCTGTC